MNIEATPIPVLLDARISGVPSKSLGRLSIPCTHTNNSNLFVLFLKFSQKCCGLSCSCCPCWMTERDGAAIRINLLVAKSQLLYTVYCLTCKSLVQFENI